MGDHRRVRRQHPPAHHRRGFLLPLASLIMLATLGSCVLAVGHRREDESLGALSVARSSSASPGAASAAVEGDDVTAGAAAPAPGDGPATGSTPGTGTDDGGSPAAGGRSLAAETTSTSMTRAVARIDDMDASGSSAAEYGVAVLDRTTGALSLGQEGTTPFYSASVVKLFTIVDILHRVETGSVTLTSAQRGDIQRALESSDDKAMDALWTAFGGPATVTGMVALAGLHDTSPPASAGEWGETRLSARDVVLVYQYVLTSLAPSDRALVINDLTNASAKGADGFDQSFGLLQSPRPTDAAAKQGWMIDGSHMYLHTTGVVGGSNQYVVAVLSKQLASKGYATGRTNMDSAVDHLTAALGVAG